MNIELFLKAIVKFLFGILLVGVLIFVPAGSFNYFEGVLFMMILFIPMFIFGVILMVKDPELLERRLNAKEKINEQKQVVLYSGLMFIFGFVISGLNYRYSVIFLPRIVVIISSILFVISYIMYAEVLRENSYLSRTIEVHKGQKVIDSGLYGIVRHPMYSATIIMFLMIPLILNSILSLIIFLVYPFIIIKRLKSEEEYLKDNLNGYKTYMKKVKYRLIPYIW